MSKPTKSSTGLKTGQFSQPESLMQPSGLPATLMHMRQLEAKEWIARYRTKARQVGAAEAQNWWRKTIMDIERIRGLEAAIELKLLMNLERKK